MSRIALAVAGLFLVACGGLPEAPEWDVVVAAPFDSEKLTVDDFLPAGVTAESTGGEPAFILPPVEVQGELGLAALCPTCPSGSTTQVPALDFGIDIDLPLMPQVVQAELGTGEAVLAATNGLGFTLLGDTGDGSGSLVVIVLDRGTGAELGRDERSGPGSEWAPGETLELVVDLGEATITDGLRVRVALDAPARDLADPVTLSSASTLGFEGALRSQSARAVTVQVDGVEVYRSSPVDLDLDAGAEDVVDERLLGAEVEFELQHDIAIEGPFVVTIADSEAALFGGDPSREITIGEFDFVAGEVQRSSLDAAAVRRIVDFADPFIGYAAVGTGTLNEPTGYGPLCRFTPASEFGTRVRISSVFRVGG